MKHVIKCAMILAVASFAMTGCGVMFGGSKFRGTIIAKDHPNTKIFVNGKQLGQGTATALHPRNQPLTVELKQDGCDPKTETFGNTFRTGNFFLSLFTWGLTGIIIDTATGASFKPDHKGNPAIIKTDVKNFVFIVDYSGCTDKPIVTELNKSTEQQQVK